MTNQFAFRTREPVCAFALLACAVTIAGAAQEAPSTDSGPMTSGPAAAEYQPKPFTDGTYAMAPGITAPKIVQAVPAAYPAGVPADGGRSVCVLSMVIGVDGVPFNVHEVRSAGDGADAAAMDAVTASKFAAGTMQVDGKEQPIPVHVTVRVVFSADHSPAIPAVLQRRFGNPGDPHGYDYPPSPIYSASPEYSEEARRKKIDGSVTISTLVTAQGLPTDLKVEKSLGYGLDEKALEAVGRYRFRPAIKDGKPVEAHIVIQVQFRLY